ncbi:MAG TPA: hypothetical protein VH678_14070 [Xanthobacteraceae bacterium]|jgi:hypothetical protein
MKFSILAVLGTVAGIGATVHADEWSTSTRKGIDASLERRIETALRDLEIFNSRALQVGPQASDGTLKTRIEDAVKDLKGATARTFRADQERLNALMRKTGIDR